MKVNNVKLEKYRICKLCNIVVLVDNNVIHCEDCDICVEGKLYELLIELDHHCVWIGKCIAKRNLRSFNIFLLGTVLFFIYSFFSLFMMLFSY